MSTGDVVTHPDWNGGRPVRILFARLCEDGLAVRYQDVNARHRAHQVILPASERGGR